MPYQPGPEPSASSGIEAVLARNERRLMAIDGVVGVGVGRTHHGDDAILIYLRDDSARSRVPRDVEGQPVETSVIGEVDAYRPPTP